MTCKQRGFISGKDMLHLFIFLVAVGVVGGIGVWELLRWLWRHLSWSWT